MEYETKTEFEIKTKMDQESKEKITNLFNRLIVDANANKFNTMTYSISRTTEPVIKEGTEEGEILGYNKGPKIFTCTIFYSGETEFVLVDPTTAKEE